MPALKQATARRELDLLVRVGLGIEPIAPALARLLRELIGAEGCFIGWFDELGTPAGFFHDSAPVSAQDLFLNNSQLFVGPDELNIFWLTRNGGLTVGNMMNPGKAFFKSNTFNLLFKACHHYHGLDLRVLVHGVIRVVVGLFRHQPQPFSEEDAYRLNLLLPALQLAVVKSTQSVGKVNPMQYTGGLGSLSRLADPSAAGHMMISADALCVNMADEQATVLLRLAKHFDQGVWLIKSMTAPPHFIQRLCLRLTGSTSTRVSLELDVAGGILTITASWIAPNTDFNAPRLLGMHGLSIERTILVTLTYQKSAAIDIVRSISELGLSPLQSRIAMFAATGGSRIECAVHHQVSKEALKKHLREIYAAFRCLDWQELHRTLNAR